MTVLMRSEWSVFSDTMMMRARAPPHVPGVTATHRAPFRRVFAHLFLLLVAFALGRVSKRVSIVYLPDSWLPTTLGDPRVYDLASVTEAAPGPGEGGEFRFEDARGAYERREFPLDDDGDRRGGGGGGASNANAMGTTTLVGGRRRKRSLFVNLVFTRAGHLRSGDIHVCAQLNVVVAGRARLTTIPDARAGEEVVRELAAGDRAVIPPHVPHLYEFVEDTLMTEAWLDDDKTQCKFKAWLYEPLRKRIPKKTLERVVEDAGGGGRARSGRG